MKLSFSRNKTRGMALMLALMAIIALTLIAASLYEASQPSWDESTMARGRYQAGILAESGLNIALHPDVKPGDVVLQQEFAPGRSWNVRMTSEGGLFPVNELGEEKMRKVAVELFIIWGLDAATANRVTDSLADWIDTDSDPLPNGAENPWYASMGYPQFPANEPFTSLEQLPFVAGMDQLERIQPFWRDYFTIESDGLIDLNAAPADLIQALTNSTPDAAAGFVTSRYGDDGIENTIDDVKITSATEARALLGMSESAWTEISSFVTFAGTVQRIESTGRVGDFTETRIILAEQVTENNKTTLHPLARLRK